MRHMSWVGLLVGLGVVLAGCVAPSETTCSDGFVCGAGQVCRPTGDGCVDQAQVVACAGRADGAACDFGFGPGTCVDQVCVIGGCGNGTPEPGEACDDGNTTSGDGCRADCAKLEACGDGVVDAGEACDDANANPADGCDACVATTWQAEARLQGAVAATAVALESPRGLVIARDGTLYVADTANSVVRRIARDGSVTTIAGTGRPGPLGDGGPATAAHVEFPAGIAVDGAGNVFVGELDAGRIRRIDGTTGVITTIAGTGTHGDAGDGGPASAASLSAPFGLAVDGLGDLVIADTYNHRVRRIDAATGIISTIAGLGEDGDSGDGGPATAARLTQPAAVAIGPDGDVFIVDSGNHRIRRVDAATGIITTVAGTGTGGFAGDGGPATSARLYFPQGIAIDAAGRLTIADSGNNRLRRVDAAGIITAIAGSAATGFAGDGGPAVAAALDQPWAVAVAADGSTATADSNNNRVRWIDAGDGTIGTVAGSGEPGSYGDGGPATAAPIGLIFGACGAPDGSVYVADASTPRVRRIDPAGVVTTFAGSLTAAAPGDGGPALAARLAYPIDVLAGPDGAVYIAELYGHRVRRVDAAGIITTVAGTGDGGDTGDGGPATAARVDGPRALALDGAGNLYVAEQFGRRVRRIDAMTGVITTVAGTGAFASTGDGGLATAAAFQLPEGLALDAAGQLYIADSVANVVRRVDTDGVIATIAGLGVEGFAGDDGPATAAALRYPSSVALDPAGGVLIADTGNRRVRRIAPDGTIATITGTGANADDGDGGPAAGAAIADVRDVAMAADGAVLVAETFVNRLRRIAPDGTITTIGGAIDPPGTGAGDRAVLADPQALVRAAPFTLIAGGASGVVQAVAPGDEAVTTLAGRYPQAVATGALARYRDATFGSVGGVAYDADAGVIYLTETSASRLHAVTIVDPADVTTWTIATVGAGTPGFADGALAGARFRDPAGLLLDDATHTLYVADAGNHVIRAIDLETATVTTVAGTPATLGFFGDDLAATDALLYAPTAVTLAPDGDLFIADTGNHRVRRVAAGTGVISTVLGDGVAASSGEGVPAWTFPVHAPRGLATDALGNLFVTSSTAVRLLPADPAGIVDGAGPVQTIYGAAPRDTFPAFATSCLTGLATVDAATLRVTDACSGLLVELTRGPAGA